MTTVYNITRDQVIVAAFRKLGIIEPADSGTNIDPNLITNAAVILNLMVKQWASVGIKLWTIQEYTLPLVAGQTSYTIGPVGPDLTADKPLRLIEGNGNTFLRNISVTPNIDIPMQILSRQEYNMLGSKYSTGQINSVYMEPGTINSIIKVYLTPDTATSTNFQLHFTAQRQLADIASSTDIPEFPNEWMNALVWNLADQLAIEFDVPANHRQEIQMRATAYLESIQGWDVEHTSTFFMPDSRMR